MCAVDTELVAKIENKGKCTDNFCGTIENIIDAENLHFTLDKRNSFLERNKIDENVRTEGFQNIVIVLESPHKNEFENKFELIAPALGTTGNKLQKHLVPIIRDMLSASDQKKYNIILTNGIQYQCSDGATLWKNNENRIRTNNIWKYFWVNGGKEYFQTRIAGYSPSIVINSCTGDITDQTSIKYLLQKSINQQCENAELYETYHPACPHYKAGCLKEAILNLDQ